MPCTDGGDQRRVEYVENGKQTSRLCAVFTVLEKNGTLDKVLKSADWVEAGVTEASTRQWWERHKNEDRLRRERERVRRLAEAKRKAALSRISETDRKLLGL